MDSLILEGTVYVAQRDDGQSCSGCHLYGTDFCEQGYEAGCSEKDIVWVREDEIRKQVEMNKFFGQVVPPVTAEEDEAFAALEKKKQVGGDHYLKAIQPWDIIRAWDLNYWEGNIVKYVLRHQGKGKVEDLEKAKHYLEYLIEHYDELY